MRNYKITSNGFLFIYENNELTARYFYSKGCEKIWEESGFERI